MLPSEFFDGLGGQRAADGGDAAHVLKSPKLFQPGVAQVRSNEIQPQSRLARVNHALALVQNGRVEEGEQLLKTVSPEDLSDSALGWVIAIPVLVLVAVLVTAVLAGVAVITTLALSFAAVLVVLALLMAFTPVVIVLSLPLLALYGLVKLFQRDQRKVTQLSQS